MFKDRQGLGALRPQHHLIFNIGNLKFRNLAKLWFFKLNWLWRNPTLKT